MLSEMLANANIYIYKIVTIYTVSIVSIVYFKKNAAEEQTLINTECQGNK
jgi:hypothetical protein